MKFCHKYNPYILGLFVLLKLSFAEAFEIKSNTPEVEQQLAAWNVIKRTLADKAHYFVPIVQNNYTDGSLDKFTIEKLNGSIRITGSSGVAVTFGFNHYLKYFCNTQIGWQVKNINIPDELPEVNITIVIQDKVRYYENVCTTSYSMVWWDIEDWQRHIDWMALNGINVALAPHGQEAIWIEVYKKMNISEDELKSFFAGPAFLSWQRMGNIQGWGGPLSTLWHQHSSTLQSFVTKAMSQLGMIPALPAFSGFVPKELKLKYPDAKMTPVDQWNGFQSEYCCPLFLDPTDPLFNTIGKLFLTEITKHYGKTHLYYSDPFNEVRPTSDDNTFIKDVASSIYKSLKDVDEDSIWLLQNWLFVHDSSYWTIDKVKSFLTAAPIGRMLILDLQSEQWPQYDKLDMYFGQPFVWCMLQNFGGTLGILGSSQIINNEVYKARNANNSTMIGIGLTPEGINQNYVMYDLMLESSLKTDSIDLKEWIQKYTTRRYGYLNDNITSAWTGLLDTVYNFKGLNKMRGKYVVTTRPKLTLKPWAWYSSNDIFEALRLFLLAKDKFNNSDGYKHDLVDITRQVLQYRADQIYILLIEACKYKNYINLKSYSEELLSLFDDLEEILSSHKHFLLSNWIEAAKTLSKSNEDENLFEYNARNQITLWGPNGEIFDYANKQWAGMVVDYYKPRWSIFLKALLDSVSNDEKLNMTQVQMDMFNNVEKPFTFSKKIYDLEPTGDSIEIAEKIYMKWSDRDYPDLPINIIPNSIGLNRKRREFHEIDEDNNVLKIEPNVVLIY